MRRRWQGGEFGDRDIRKGREEVWERFLSRWFYQDCAWWQSSLSCWLVEARRIFLHDIEADPRVGIPIGEEAGCLVLGSATRDQTDRPLLCISAAWRIEMLLTFSTLFCHGVLRPSAHGTHAHQPPHIQRHPLYPCYPTTIGVSGNLS